MNGGVFMSDIEILPPIGVSGFEVYKTENDPEFSLGENSKDKFVALNGTTTEIACYDNMYDNSFDEDYEGISNNEKKKIRLEVHEDGQNRRKNFC